VPDVQPASATSPADRATASIVSFSGIRRDIYRVPIRPHDPLPPLPPVHCWQFLESRDKCINFCAQQLFRQIRHDDLVTDFAHDTHTVTNADDFELHPRSIGQLQNQLPAIPSPDILQSRNVMFLPASRKELMKGTPTSFTQDRDRISCIPLRLFVMMQSINENHIKNLLIFPEEVVCANF
jgi:hypothetical protein